ncbi:MAG: hypothetical protein IJ697_04430 [Synergistaceae bacterium]|nr:hypothetical protein [Synergistaceae bacterium]
MRRKGETFTEFLMAAAVFGVMMTGIFEFMANQTDNLAKIRHMDDLMYHAQVYMNAPKNNKPDWDDKDKIAYDTSTENTLIIKKKGKKDDEQSIVSMTFKLKP